MCRECAAAQARQKASSDFLAQCRAMWFGESLKAVMPLETPPTALAALAAQIDRSLIP